MYVRMCVCVNICVSSHVCTYLHARSFKRSLNLSRSSSCTQFGPVISCMYPPLIYVWMYVSELMVVLFHFSPYRCSSTAPGIAWNTCQYFFSLIKSTNGFKLNGWHHSAWKGPHSSRRPFFAADHHLEHDCAAHAQHDSESQIRRYFICPKLADMRNKAVEAHIDGPRVSLQLAKQFAAGVYLQHMKKKKRNKNFVQPGSGQDVQRDRKSNESRDPPLHT